MCALNVGCVKLKEEEVLFYIIFLSCLEKNSPCWDFFGDVICIDVSFWCVADVCANTFGTDKM